MHIWSILEEEPTTSCTLSSVTGFHTEKFRGAASPPGPQVWLGYPGQRGGSAFARLAFGETDFSGRLPVSWYGDFDLPMTDMSMRAGRTYRFADPSRIVYPFGTGLQYSAFHYAWADPGACSLDVQVSADVRCGTEREGKVHSIISDQQSGTNLFRSR